MTADESLTKSKIIPSRRKTSTIANLLYPESAPSTPPLSEEQELDQALAESRAELER